MTRAGPGGPETETAHAASVLDEAARETRSITDAARRRLGIQLGDEAEVEPLRPLLARSGVGLYPLVALSALVIVDEFQGYAFDVLTPDIAASLGIGLRDITLLVALKQVVVAIASLGLAASVQSRPRRASLAIITAILWTVFTFGTGFVTTVWALAFVLLADGASTGSTRALHTPLLLDHYPSGARMRVLSAYRGADSFGNVLAPLAVALLAFGLDLTWRGVFLGMGLASALGTVIALRLRDPGFGRFDEDVVSGVIAENTGTPGGEALPPSRATADDVSLGFFEIVKRVMLVPTVRRLLVAFAVVGAFVVPLRPIVSFFLDEQFGLDTTQRALFFAANAAASMVALAIYGSRGEKAFARDPRRVMDQTGWFLLAAVAMLVAGALTPNLVLVGVLFALFSSLTVVVIPGLTLSVFAVVPSRMRPHVAALLTIYLAGVGGLAGALLLGSIEERFGLTTAMVSMVFPAVIGALVLRTARHTLLDDIDAMIAEQVIEEELRHRQSVGTPLPMLACRGINFSYGPLHVLFDIDFTVDDGEMVALLGTNGAGKSTLLKVISGIGLPSRGTIRYAGSDVTYLDAERRVRLGITQVPGGKAVFGPLTVAENLRLYGYSMGRSARRTDTRIEECFVAFPRLGERRNQLAQTLSGGEQQMLALSKALLLNPRLLLIDELSLGLAPIIVSQLMTMVREINAAGTAVVLVEQSVNIALELVEHAYFMEKGEIRFDGAADDLLARGDLLRAVFLSGADAHTDDASRDER